MGEQEAVKCTNKDSYMIEKYQTEIREFEEHFFQLKKKCSVCCAEAAGKIMTGL
jgi:hypothetical protein